MDQISDIIKKSYNLKSNDKHYQILLELEQNKVIKITIKEEKVQIKWCQQYSQSDLNKICAIFLIQSKIDASFLYLCDICEQNEFKINSEDRNLQLSYQGVHHQLKYELILVLQQLALTPQETINFLNQKLIEQQIKMKEQNDQIEQIQLQNEQLNKDKDKINKIYEDLKNTHTQLMNNFINQQKKVNKYNKLIGIQSSLKMFLQFCMLLIILLISLKFYQQQQQDPWLNQMKDIKKYNLKLIQDLKQEIQDHKTQQNQNTKDIFSHKDAKIIENNILIDNEQETIQINDQNIQKDQNIKKSSQNENVERNNNKIKQSSNKDNNKKQNQEESQTKNESKILSNIDFKSIGGWIERADNKNIKFKLLYQASVDGFENNSLLEQTENRNQTLVVIHTDQNKKFGVYTDLQWKGDNNANDLYSETRSFIFSLDLNKKYPFNAQQNNSDAIRPTEYYVCFGKDICIRNHSNISNLSFTQFHHYGNRTQLNGTNLSRLRNFTSKEVEVYEVVQY